MALKYNNNYYRIIKTTKNLLNNTTDVEFFVYENEEQRQLEKQLEPQVNTFLARARTKLDIDQNQLDEALNSLLKLAEEQGRDFHELLYEADALKEQYNIQNANISEYEMLRDNMFSFKEVLNEKQLLEKWEALGLTEDMLHTNVNKANVKYTLDGHIEKVSDMYTLIKNKSLENAEDC